MRRALWATIVIGVIIALDLVLANFLVAVPTAQAISSVEHSASFQGIVENGTYQYQGYTGSPAWHSRCMRAGESLLHYLDPFHEYVTTTLIFLVEPPPSSLTMGPFPFFLLVQVNPATGEIYSIQTQQTEPICT